jgi:hypothetical protein
MFAVAGEHIRPGDDPLEELSLDVPVAAVMRHLQHVYFEASVVFQAARCHESSQNAVAPCIAGQQDRAASELGEADDARQVRDALVGIGGEERGLRHAVVGDEVVEFLLQRADLCLRRPDDHRVQRVAEIGGARPLAWRDQKPLRCVEIPRECEPRIAGDAAVVRVAFDRFAVEPSAQEELDDEVWTARHACARSRPIGGAVHLKSRARRWPVCTASRCAATDSISASFAAGPAVVRRTIRSAAPRIAE